MAGITIDIKTRILPDDHRVFIVRPGANYGLYEEVADKAVILFDLPGMSLNPGVTFSEIENIEAQVLRGQAIRAWYRVGRHTGQPHPSIELADYPHPESATERRSLGQLMSIGAAYFERARVGDMVIVPPRRFGDPVMVGEIIEGEPVETTVAAYAANPVWGRKVRWLASIEKKAVPARVIEISQKPNSFVLLDRSTAIWFYDRVYKSYSLGPTYQCELRIGAETFGSTDDAKLTAFLNFVVANLAALEKDGERVSLSQSIFANLGDYEPEKRISINSPGEIIIAAIRRSPIVFVVLLGLAGCNPAEVAQAVDDGTLTIGNSAGLPDDPCAAEVYKSTVDWLTFVGAEAWVDACKLANEALNSAEVELPVTVNAGN